MKQTYESIFQQMDEWEMVIFDREEEFLKKFAILEEAIELTRVSFNTVRCHFNYYVDSGQHFSDSCKIEDFLEWLNQ